MDDIVSGLVREVPAIVAILVVILLFIRHIQKRDEIITHVSNECHDVQREAHAIMRETKEHLGRNAQIMEQMHKLLLRMNGGK